MEQILKIFDFVKEETILYEINYLIVFMISEECILFKNRTLLNFLKENEKKIINKIIFDIFKYIGLNFGLKNKEILALKNSIISSTIKSFFKISFFFNLSISISEERELTNLEKCFPRHSSLVLTVINTKEFNEFVKGSQFTWNESYHEILLNMICIIEPCFIEKKKLILCVDFSKGDNYTRFLIKKIQSIEGINIKFQKKVNSQTDIFISDTYLDKVNIKNILLRDYPTLEEWKDLEKILVLFYNKKMFF